MTREVLPSREGKLDSQISRQGMESVVRSAGVGEAVAATLERGSIPHGWWLVVQEQRKKRIRAVG